MTPDQSSFSVRLTRGSRWESSHVVHAAVVHPDGRTEVWGDPELPVQPRSAIKFVQALPLLTTGAADRYSVTDIELALACSSHSAEPAHTEAVLAWLDRIGLGQDDLACGPDVPIGQSALLEFRAEGRRPDDLHNCCSGKHAGFLTMARALDVDPSRYIDPDHPVQREVTASIEAMTGTDTSLIDPGRDGCGIPVHPVRLVALARAMRRLVTGDGLAPELAAACRGLVDATIGKAYWVSGHERHEYRLEGWVSEPVLTKGGAEGVYAAALPDRGVGIALKVADGAGRAAELALSGLLARLEVLAPERARRQLTNKAGRPVGFMEPIVGESTILV